jgi:hypothetical protein
MVGGCKLVKGEEEYGRQQGTKGCNCSKSKRLDE